MKKVRELIDEIKHKTYSERFLDIYCDEDKMDYQEKRYIEALEEFEKEFGESEVSIYSAPGRSEVCGNHTDHQHGEVLATSINLDTLAVVSMRDDNIIQFISKGYEKIEIDVSDIKKNENEKETTIALIKGVLYGLKKRGYEIGGFNCFSISDVLIGAGLSSSASFEILLATIISDLYNEGVVDSVEMAIVGQYAENEYFGKPCGLMDQMACSVGNLVHIDFKNPDEPLVEKTDFDINQKGYSLCITDTKGSHADLTEDYALVPKEMKSIAKFFNKEYLIEIDEEDFYKNIAKLRKECSDRAILRAIHFYEENNRVKRCIKACENNDICGFLDTIKESGDSSFKYLQNVYTNHDIENQNISIALAVSEKQLGNKLKGVCRVHGGGFAGTIQAFVKNEYVSDYKKAVDHVFYEGSCKVLKIRKYGGIKVM